MENENTAGELNITGAETVIAGVAFDADGWVKETLFNRVFPSILMTAYFCAAAIAILSGIY